MDGQDWHWLRIAYLLEGDTLPKHREVQERLAAHHYWATQVTMDFEDYLWNAPYAPCVANHDEKSIQYLRSSYLATAWQFMNFYRLRSSRSTAVRFHSCSCYMSARPSSIAFPFAEAGM